MYVDFFVKKKMLQVISRDTAIVGLQQKRQGLGASAAGFNLLTADCSFSLVKHDSF